MDIQKNDIVEVLIESLGYRGEGIARIGRVPVFIVGALTGEKVRAVIILVKKDFFIGKLLEILQSAPSRVVPRCPFFGRCGGCDLQHLDYDKQLEFKTAQVLGALKKIAGINAEVGQCVSSDKIYGCRNKLSMPVRQVGGEVKTGFFAYNSHRIVEIGSCCLQSDRANSVLPIFAEWAKGETAYDEERGSGNVRHISVREIGSHIIITVVCTQKTDLLPLDSKLSFLKDYALYLNINKAHNNVIFGNKTILCGGQEREVEVFGQKTTVHPVSFLQVNDFIAEKIYTRVAEMLKSAQSQKVLDAYSGGGLLSCALANAVSSVTGVEIVPEAVESARKLASGRSNINFICGDCAEVIPQLTASAGFDTIILDPPRNGCDEKVISAVGASGASTVIYISCNPSTLARDLFRLSGYEIAEIIPFDMFPQTKHVETLCYLRGRVR